MSSARLRNSSFDLKKLDPNYVLKFNIQQKRNGARSFLPGYATKRLAVLHLRDLTLNICDVKNHGVGAKSYRTDSITRCEKSGKRTLTIYMQRGENTEHVKQYQFNDSKACMVFENILEVMNKYGQVVNHLYEQNSKKANGAGDADSSPASASSSSSYARDVAKDLEKYMGLIIAEEQIKSICGPETGMHLTLRQLFHVVVQAEATTTGGDGRLDSRMDASSLSSTTTSSGSVPRDSEASKGLSFSSVAGSVSADNGGASATTGNKTASFVGARKRIASAVELIDGEVDDVDVLHGRVSLQWRRLVDGRISHVYLSGSLSVTRFRIMFVAHSKHVRARRMSQYLKSAFSVSIPITSIVHVEKDRSSGGIVLKTKDFRVLTLKVNDSHKIVENIVERIRGLLYFEHDLVKDRKATARVYLKRVFAFASRLDDDMSPMTGWKRFGVVKDKDGLSWLQTEYRRIGLIESLSSSSSTAGGGDKTGKPDASAKKRSVQTPAKWREFLNQKHAIVDTYPKYLIIPSKFHMPEHEFFQALEFRSKKRLPAVTWQDPVKRTILARSSQPLVGINGKHDVADEKLVDLYRKLGTPSRGGSEDAGLTIVDCRALIAARGNYARGGGYENIGRYKKCEMKFLNIDNIHTMRGSVAKLGAMCGADIGDGGDEDWLQNVASTKWLRHVSRVLAGSVRIARLLRVEGRSVLCHCSDGWDRTSQVCAVAQLLLDPYYRTIDGFATLVEKDWCSFGHKFHDRIGHGKEPELGAEDSGVYFPTKESSPVFLQFLDAVAQIQRQLPDAFEFNKAYLLFLVDASYSCEYGNFLCNNERERAMLDVYRKTCSVWDFVESRRSLYTNPSYAVDEDVLWPSHHIRHLAFWDDFFLRYDPCCLHTKADAGVISPMIASKRASSRMVAATKETTPEKKSPDLPRGLGLTPEATVQ